MDETQTEGGQQPPARPDFDAFAEKIGGKLGEATTALEQRLTERLSGIEERIGGVESRFAPPKQDEKPSNWEAMDDDERFAYVQRQAEKEIGSVKQELSGRQAALEAARLAPRIVKGDDWKFGVDGAAEIAAEIVEGIALSDPQRAMNLDALTRQDIIDVAEGRARRKAPAVAQDTVQGSKGPDTSDIERIKAAYAKQGAAIDDDKAKRIIERLKSYEPQEVL